MQNVSKIVLNSSHFVPKNSSFSSVKKDNNSTLGSSKINEIKMEKIDLDLSPVERFSNENRSSNQNEILILNQKIEDRITIQKFLENLENEFDQFINKNKEYLEDDYLEQLKLEKEKRYTFNEVEGWDMKSPNYYAVEPFIRFIKENRNQIDPNQLIYYIKMFEDDKFSRSLNGREILFSDGSVLTYDEQNKLVLLKEQEDIKKKYEDVYLENLKNEEKKLYEYGLNNTYIGADLFIDFVKHARDEQELSLLNSYIDAYENHAFLKYKEDSIEFLNGVKIYYDENGNVVFSDPKLDYKKIVYTDEGVLKYTTEYCLKYNKRNDLTEITDLEGHFLDYFEDLPSYGGSQTDFKKKIDMILEDEEYLKIMNKYYPEADIEDVELFSYILCNKGCGYVSLANSLYVYYEDKPDEFYKNYGFPMYTLDENGEIVSNVNYLIYDIALHRYQDLPIEEVYGNVNTVNKNELTDAALDDSQKVEGKFQGTTVTSIDDFFAKYVKDKGLELDLEVVKKMDKETYESLLAEGKQVIISSKGYDLYVDKDQDGIYETLKIEDGGSHAMYLTAIDENNNFIVSSWGKEYKFEAPSVFGWEDYYKYEIISFEEIKHG